jgi:acetyl-CoA carboxylase alpha subunit
MQSPYEDREEEALHQSVVNALAEEIHQPVENVKIVYEVELARLKSRAKVKDYLALLASRRAREKLLGKHPA